MNIEYHYPHELHQLLVDTIPLLCRSKKDLLIFFAGAGVKGPIMNNLALRIRENRDSIHKYEMTRMIITWLNEQGEQALRERREVLRRIAEWEDFSTCWPDDQLKAQGLVTQIQRLVNVKDSFTRMNLEREEAERKARQVVNEARVRDIEEHKNRLSSLKKQLYSLFDTANAQKRGKDLENILNNLFKVYDILIREAFILKGDDNEGIIEQIDGVIEIDGTPYLVEMKWWQKPIGKGEIAQHLVRLYQRGDGRGIFISASGYTEPALIDCKEALQQRVIVLCELREIIRLLEEESSLIDLLKAKIRAAMIDKKPLFYLADFQ